MKLKTILAAVAATGMLLGGCSRPDTIPDDELKAIFRDIYLVNAWCEQHPIECDSVDVYEPIFERHGYTSQDVIHTLNTFTRRKSARLSDIVNAAVNELVAQSKAYAERIALLDRLDSIALERSAQVVYRDTLIRVRRTVDTARLRVRIPAEEGSYRVSYNYTIGPYDRNERFHTLHALLDTTGRIRASTNNWMARDVRKHYSTRLTTAPGDRELMIRFASYGKDMKRPDITIDSLVIVHYPDTEEALRRMGESQVNYKLLIDGKEYNVCTQDSCSLYVVPPLAPAATDSIP